MACRSAAFILKNVNQSKYNLFALGIDHKGDWYLQDTKKLLSSITTTTPIETNQKISVSIESLLKILDVTRDQLVVIPSLHGAFGEDGTLQGMLEMSQIAYVGPDTLASSVCMDKEITKRLVAQVGIPIVPFKAFRDYEWQSKRQEIIKELEKTLSYPMFVKPANSGSAVGVNKAKNSDDLIKACEAALQNDDKILVEKAMDAHEIEFAVMGNYEPRVSTPGEVQIKGEFFNYQEKYSAASTQEFVIPAPIGAEKIKEGQELTKRAWKALQLHGLSRIDWFLCRKTNVYHLNEVNTIPGFTAISGFPLMWKHDGLSGEQVINDLIGYARERHNTKMKLQRTYCE